MAYNLSNSLFIMFSLFASNDAATSRPAVQYKQYKYNTTKTKKKESEKQ